MGVCVRVCEGVCVFKGECGRSAHVYVRCIVAS